MCRSIIHLMIVVVGLAFEARIAAGPGLRVICSGDGRNLAATIAREFSAGCPGLVSFGVAGGLAPELSSGSCVVASNVLSEEGNWTTDGDWSERMLSAVPGAVSGALIGVPAPVARPEDKQALHRKTGAVAVDMESHIVARMAAAFNVPFAAIRVITDPAKRALPRSALAGMRPDGTTNVAAVLRALVRRPADLPALFQTALDARTARAALLRGRQLLGPGLGLADLRKLELDVP